MKLHYAQASPFARKVRVVAIETGLAARIEDHEVSVSPLSANAEVIRDNPLGKIPALVTDDGEALFDSRVICEYLDGLHGGRKLFPAAGPERWTALRRQAQADGLMDAAVLTRYETAMRPQDRQWPDWIEGQKAKVARALDALENEAARLGGTVDIGTIAIACALGYLDFRFADDRWRDGRPRLAAWYPELARRDSMTATEPPPT